MNAIPRQTAAVLTSADIAIVGGGAAAAAMVLALAAHTTAACSVLWVAPADCDGRGLAYSTRDAAHRLNVPAARMSARADRPSDWVDFLNAVDGHADPCAYYPRRRYGDYLARRVADGWTQLRGERWLTVATGARHDGRDWILLGADGLERRAQHLLLAIGPQAQHAPAGVDPALLRSHRYRIDPYVWANTAQPISHVSDIVIIGSGLTAVDLVLSAARQNGAAVIHLLSRHGALPATHAAPQPPMADLLDGADRMPAVSQMLRLLRARGTSGDWRARVDSLRERSGERWQRWSLAEQRRFLRHARWAWDCARHRMAPEIAAAIAALRQNGRLQVHQGRLLSATPDQQRVAVRWRPRGSESIVDHRTDLVLQATGLNTAVSRTSDPLLRSLLDGGWARADALDMGLAVDTDQALLGTDAQPRGDAHVLGALARGSRYECLAMPEIRTTAAAIAKRLATAQVGKS